MVKEVHLAFTLLTNEDEELIIIPNKHIVGEILHNSQTDTILELSVGVAYDSDTDAAMKAIKAKLENVEGLSQERNIQIGIEEFGDSAINIACSWLGENPRVSSDSVCCESGDQRCAD